MKRAAAVAMFVLLGVTAAAAAPARIARLSGDTVPVSYDLSFVPHVDRSTVDTSETILVRTKRPLAYITLNASGLEISAIDIDGLPATSTLHPAIEQLDVAVPGRTLPAGLHTVRAMLTSRIATRVDARVGDYLGFSNVGSPKEPFLVTMFEPSTARRMFACFDEPSFRARFRIKIAAPSTFTAISNMPMTSRVVKDRIATSTFAQTPPMPTYLLTADVAKMAAITATANGVPVRVLTTPAQIGSARATLDDAVASLRFFEEFFGVRYPLPKLDLVVAPADDDTALEQWGAITYYSPMVFERSNAVGRYEAFDLVAHEIAHQWVGDLVTMRWWRDTLVAEGLAEYAAAEAEQALRPQWRTWEFSDHAVQEILNRGVDSHAAAVALRIGTDLDREDEAVFDNATYDQPMAVLTQYERVVGMPAVRASLHRYLTRHAYGSASIEDLWSSFPGDSSGYFAPWFLRPGFPMVAISQYCENGRRFVSLRQMPFANDSAARARFAGRLWPVPVVIESGSARDAFFLTSSAQVRSEGACEEPLVVDGDFFPFYRMGFTNIDRWRTGTWPRRAQQWVFTGEAQLHRASMAPAAEFLDALVATAPNLQTFSLTTGLNDLLAIDRGLTAPARLRFESTLAPAVRPALLRFDSHNSRTQAELVSLLTMLPPTTPQPHAYTALVAALRSRPNTPDGLTPPSLALRFIAVTAGQQANAAQAHAVLNANAANPQLRSNPLMLAYLNAVRNDDALLEIYHWIASHPNNQVTDPVAFFIAAADRNPAFVERLLHGSAEAQLRKAGRQSFAGLAYALAQRLALVETPDAYGRWLRALRPQSDERVIDEAVAAMRKKQNESRTVQRDVEAWLTARGVARSSTPMRRRSDGCVAKSSSYHSGC